MRCHKQRLVPVLMTLSLLFLVVMPVWAADPEIDACSGALSARTGSRTAAT